MLTRVFVLLIIMLTGIQCFGSCPDYQNGIIWKGNDPFISFYELASHAAPMLWFSPDETLLYDDEGVIQLPQPFPFEKSDKPVVYYKIRNLYAEGITPYAINSADKESDFKVLDLRDIVAFDLDFYYYFREETGLGSHPHDIESMTLQVQVIKVPDCTEFKYGIVIKRVIARAHGLHWYNSVFDVDEQTYFPLSILIEEGKHASATDKNADGIFTPGFDVTHRVNDAWGVRDVITTGRLFSGGYQGWMAKPRDHQTLLFPPLPEMSPCHSKLIKKFGDHITEKNVYTLRPYPEYPRHDIDEKLEHLMKGKKPHKWPKVEKAMGDASVKQWLKEERVFRAVGVSYRWDDAGSISLAIPLFIFKSVEAPLTGGWIYHKIYGGRDSLVTSQGFNYDKILGHQIVHSSSASRWIDTYIGLGYEIHDNNVNSEIINDGFQFVSEAGIKIRLNIGKTPLKFLKHLGTDFWGIRLGWKNVGFRSFRTSGFVLEIGAGAF